MSGHSAISVGDRCPTPSELNAFVSGEASSGASLKIEAHVSLCPRCMAAVDQLEEQSDVIVRTLATLPVSADDEHEFRQLHGELLARPMALPAQPVLLEASAGEQSAHPHHPPLPGRLGAYELLDELGRGATGAVYRVRHQKLDRVFAMKVLHNEQSADVESSVRFLREMKAVGKLDHPHIVRATDGGEDQGYQYLVMEYSAGLDVSDILRRLGPLSIADACEIARQAAMGLQHAHQYGVVHRDVKPSNLLLTCEGQVKLLDLGLVAVSHVKPEALLERNPRGTADYMAPEQWTDYPHVDQRADLYSLGCTLFKMLAGVAPFHSLPGEFASKMTAHLSAEIPRLSVLRAGVSPELERLLARLLAKRPDDRYQSAVALLEDLTPLAKNADLQSLAEQVGLSSHAPHPTRPGEIVDTGANFRRRINRRTVLLGCAVAASLTAIYGRRVWRFVPGILTEKWRALTPVSSELLLSLDDRANWKYEPDDGSILLDSDQYALVNLGQPLTGVFSVRTAWKLLSKDCRAGVFFRYRERLQNHLLMHDFHLLEYIPTALDGPGRSMLQWSHVLVQGAPANRQVQRKLWAWTSATAESDRLELETTLGMEGFPGIIWNGTRLPESAWTLTSDGRQKSQISKERLRTDYRGCLGVLVSHGAARFHQPQLMYHESH